MTAEQRAALQWVHDTASGRLGRCVTLQEGLAWIKDNGTDEQKQKLVDINSILFPEPDDPYRNLIAAAREAAELLLSLYSEPPDQAIKLQAAANALARHLRVNVGNCGRRLELHRFPDRKLDYYERVYLAAADEDGEDDELEFSDFTAISESDDDGEYVLGWKWVDFHRAPPLCRFDGSMYCVLQPSGEKRFVARRAVLAVDQQHAFELLMEQLWEHGTDFSEREPTIEWHPVPLRKFEFTRGSEVLTVQAVDEAEAREIALIMGVEAEFSSLP